MTHPIAVDLKRLLAALGLISVLLTPVFALQDFDAQKLLIARTQHDIIQLLLKERNFDAVFPELDKIFGLRLPAEHEDKVVREVRIIADAFYQNQRADLSIRVLERGTLGVAHPKSKAELCQEMGYVYRLQGNDMKAMECFRKAQQFAQKLTARPF